MQWPFNVEENTKAECEFQHTRKRGCPRHAMQKYTRFKTHLSGDENAGLLPLYFLNFVGIKFKSRVFLKQIWDAAHNLHFY